MRSAWRAQAGQAAASGAQAAAEPGMQPKKRLYRSRAHSNPLNDQHFSVPAHPDAYDWCAARALAAPGGVHCAQRPTRAHTQVAALPGALRGGGRGQAQPGRDDRGRGLRLWRPAGAAGHDLPGPAGAGHGDQGQGRARCTGPPPCTLTRTAAHSSGCGWPP